MNTVIDVIGAAGDLGSQLTTRLRERGMIVAVNDLMIEQSTSLDDMLRDCSIIHVCAPLEATGDLLAHGDDTLIVLHDSVMDYSRSYSRDRLHSSAAVVHMLMNERQSVVVASDAPHAAAIAAHMSDVGYATQLMSR
jgi:nucleoside-diphosphate-sugar epimerase